MITLVRKYRLIPFQSAFRKNPLLLFLDVPRTFPENIYFQNTPTDPLGKRGPLFNILYALAVKNKEVGYCQVG